MSLLYGVRISSEVSFVLSQFTRLTDGQTYDNAIASTALHSMQRGKNRKPVARTSLKS